MTKFAEALEMSVQNLSQYLNDKIEPGSVLIKKLRKLGFDLNELYDDTMLVRESSVDYRDKRISEMEEKIKKLEYAIKQIERITENLKG